MFYYSLDDQNQSPLEDKTPHSRRAPSSRAFLNSCSCELGVKESAVIYEKSPLAGALMQTMTK